MALALLLSRARTSLKVHHYLGHLHPSDSQRGVRHIFRQAGEWRD
jgi:hypothetical protein